MFPQTAGETPVRLRLGAIPVQEGGTLAQYGRGPVRAKGDQ